VGFDEAEVKRYHTVFWKKLQTLPEWEKLENRVSRGDARREKQKDIIAVLKGSFADVKDPYTEISISELVGVTQSKDWIPENDLWLLVNTNVVGYGNWKRVKKKIGENPSFGMDWFMLTRTPEDLKERCDKLLKMILEKQKRRNNSSASRAAMSSSATSATGTSAAASAPKKRGPPKSRGGGGAEESNDEAASSSKRGGAKKKRKEGPKRAASSYLCFMTEKRAALREEQPGLTFAEVSRECGDAWKALSAVDRKKYEDLAAKDVIRYEAEKKQWKLDHPEEEEADNKAASEKKKKGENAALKKAGDPLFPGLPEAPPAAYRYYQGEQKDVIKAANPNMSAAEIQKVMAKNWKELDAEGKKKYQKMQVEATQEYTKSLATWRKENKELAAQYDKFEKEKKDASAAKRKLKKLETIKADTKQTTIKTTGKGKKRDGEGTSAEEQPGATKKAKEEKE
jgi:hypothetical protein